MVIPYFVPFDLALLRLQTSHIFRPLMICVTFVNDVSFSLVFYFLSLS